MSPKTRAIIHISTSQKSLFRINYSRRMYAIIRKYTPDVVEGDSNECFADLTGLRTFFKMTYSEIAEKIKKDLAQEIGIRFSVQVATERAFTNAKKKSKGTGPISTYKEINSLFVGSILTNSSRAVVTRKKRFIVPFIGKVN